MPWEPAEDRDDGVQQPHGSGNLLQQFPERWELRMWVLVPLERSRDAGAVSPDRELGRDAWLELQSSWRGQRGGTAGKDNPEHPLSPAGTVSVSPCSAGLGDRRCPRSHGLEMPAGCTRELAL